MNFTRRATSQSAFGYWVRWAAFSAAGTVLCASAYASIPSPKFPNRGPSKLRPVWARSGEVAEHPNCSILADTKPAEVNNPLKDVLDHRDELALRQQVESIHRAYDLKQAYGLARYQEDQDFRNQISDIGKDVLSKARSRQIKKKTEELKELAARTPELRQLVKPVALVGGVVAIATGSPVDFKLSETMLLRSRTDAPRQKGQLSLFSEYFDGSVEMNARAAEISGQKSVDPTQSDERYRVSVSRGLPVLDMSTGLTYGASSSTMSASVSKRLTENLTAVVDSIRPVDSSRGGVGQETVRLLYGMTF